MFSRISRYRDLPDVTTVDASGRRLESRSLRIGTQATATFRHVVEEGERLDHLAFKYYDQPREWWRIGEANPEFLSPVALLGQGPRTTVRIPLAWDGPVPRWSELLRGLSGSGGVDSVLLGTTEQPRPDVQVLQGTAVSDLDVSLTTALDAAVVTQTLPPALLAALSAAGVDFVLEVRPAKVDAVTWRITELQTRRVFTIRHVPGDALLNLYRSVWSFHWSVTVHFNTIETTVVALLEVIEEIGFEAGPPGPVRRIGKSILIPPRTG